MKRRMSNPLALVVLSLLCERPMHPYEIAAQMRFRGLQENFKLNYGSLYSVIEVLQREALIVAHGTERSGRLPERTVYAVTDVGRTAFLEWLRSLLRTPTKEYPQFAGGLALMGHLPPAEAAALLEHRIRLLTEAIDAKRANVAAAQQMGVDRIFLIEEEYGLLQLDTEVAWVQGLIREIGDGTLTETRDGVLTWKVTNPDLAYLSVEEGGEAADS